MTGAIVQRFGTSKDAESRPGDGVPATWIVKARKGSKRLLNAIEKAGVRP